MSLTGKLLKRSFLAMTAATSINIECKEANNVFARLIIKATTFHIKCNQTKNVLTYNKLNEPNSVVSKPHQRFLPPPKKKIYLKEKIFLTTILKQEGGILGTRQTQEKFRQALSLI